MTAGQKREIYLSFLFLFLLLTLSMHFFHTENTIKRSDTCPACHFQNSTLMTACIPFFHLPPLSFLEKVRIIEIHPSFPAFHLSPSSRSPPSA